MRFLFVTAAAAALAACSPPPVPDSGAGVGFGNYEEYQRRQQERDAQLAGNAVPAANALSSEIVASSQAPATGEGSDLAAETQAALNAGRRGAAPEPAPEAVSSSGISQENNFDAVGAQRSIESDAAKIAQNRAQYKVVEAEALPSRPGGEGPNIVDYALATKHPVGTRVYRRIGVNLDGKAARNCAKYASPDKAQSAFLSRGGPKRDKLGLDPDGDGFACSWDPGPFRKAVGG